MNDASIHDLQLLIASWADQLHPKRTPLSVVCKLLEEIAELIGSDKMSDPMELADIFILALDLAYLQGTDISRVVIEKMVINAGREWIIQDNGRMTHVK